MKPLPEPLSRRVAFLMDDVIRVPGTDFRFGADAIVGLVPGVGDVLGSAMSSVILVDAVRCRAPLTVISRMGLNLLVDAALGLLPGVGDVADAAHRANRKNLHLLERAIADGRCLEVSSTGYVLRATALIIAVLAVVLGAAALTIWLLFKGIGRLTG